MIKKPSAHLKSRRTHAVNAFKNATETIGAIERGMHLFAITRGQFSMIDAILHTLDQVGRAKVTCWTWAIAAYEVESLERLMIDGRLTGAELIIDFSAKERNAAIIANWKKRFGNSSVRYVVNHAKIATVESEAGHKVLLRGSMNLNFNPRFEQLDVTEGGADFDLIKEIEAELPTDEDPEQTSWTQVNSRSGIQDAFDFTENKMNIFKTPKTWAK